MRARFSASPKNLPPPGLTITGLTLHHGGRPVLDALSFDVQAGALTALVGPQGSGKSALMRVLAGFEHAQAGSITLDGETLGRTPVHRRGFGVVQQPDRLLPHMSLVENVALPLRLRGIRRAARLAQARDMLELTQLDARPGSRACDASQADLQRTLLARAAVFGPRLMLLDEPFAGGCDSARFDLISALARIHQLLGTSILLATRHLRDALPICAKIVVLRQGTLEQSGAAEEIFTRPASAFVAELGGETNRLAGTVKGQEDDICAIRLACGPIVEARATQGAAASRLAAGQACLVILRPEHIAVAPVPAAEMGDGALDAILIEAQFWGDSYRLRLLIGSGAELVVRRPSIAGLRGLAPGRPCAVAWQSHHAMVFASPPS